MNQNRKSKAPVLATTTTCSRHCTLTPSLITRCGLNTGGDNGDGVATGAGGGNAARLQGNGFYSFTAGAGVLLLEGIIDDHGVGQLTPPLTPDHPMSFFTSPFFHVWPDDKPQLTPLELYNVFTEPRHQLTRNSAPNASWADVHFG
ncbi:MAG: hypothetical protein CK538_02350 [Opitutia bacterium]|nr:hypothetical protein [Opitutaceae bacterium]PHX86620.1 MAG: hypothetical protein CK538_02350 [Opitutae bacterium]